MGGACQHGAALVATGQTCYSSAAMQSDRPPGSECSIGQPSAGAAAPLSLSRLREAFAAMLAPQRDEKPAATDSRASAGPDRAADDGSPGEAALQADPCEINPRSVVEAMLFVGRPDGGSLSAREMAAAMRGCSPTEIDAAVAELNTLYARDGAPYEIVSSATGFRLALRGEFARMRDKLYGRVRETRLYSSALEVLSIVAYNQPTTAEEINRLRDTPSGAVLATLVRRRLVRLERSDEGRQPPRYWTTDRFLRLLGLESLAVLPQSEELEKG